MKNKIILYILLIICVLYLLNTTAGIVELLPDNIPIVGNIDEAGIGALIYYLVQELKNEKTQKSKS